MALRTILTAGDEMLQKKCRPVTAFDDRLATLLDDMTETLLQSGGVGLAAPQVGVLRRVVVLLDINKDEEVVELVNPEVIEMNELEKTVEGCLSVPGKYGYVMRPTHAKIATATGLTGRATAWSLSASATRLSIWTVICSPKRFWNTWIWSRNKL